jgi:DNA-binding response OmpR family regulator
MRLLIVDDDAAMRRFVRRVLSWYEVEEIVEAADGDEAIWQFQRFLPDGIVLDLDLPGRTGAEVLREIRRGADRPETPVLVVSAVAQRDRILEIRELGAQGYLLKPVDIKRAHAEIGAFVALVRGGEQPLR